MLSKELPEANNDGAHVHGRGHGESPHCQQASIVPKRKYQEQQQARQGFVVEQSPTHAPVHDCGGHHGIRLYRPKRKSLIRDHTIRKLQEKVKRQEVPKPH